jgi:multisubunit Na+/H+ antiporter MnhE subunit
VVEARLRLQPGFARNAFCVIASLLPGTLLTGFDSDDDQKTYVHGLDVRQPIAAELADEEASFMRMIDHE